MPVQHVVQKVITASVVLPLAEVSAINPRVVPLAEVQACVARDRVHLKASQRGQQRLQDLGLVLW